VNKSYEVQNKQNYYNRKIMIYVNHSHVILNPLHRAGNKTESL